MNGRDMVITGLGVTAPGVTKPADALDPAPAQPGWFDLATALPGRGYRRLPPGCQYLLAAAAAAIADAGDCWSGVPTDRRGVVVGTNNAGAALLDAIDHTVIDGHADRLSPLTAPFMAMSLFASRLSTEHAVHGFNLTANSPRTAGLEAVQLGARALASDRARVLLVGATEDPPPPGQFDAARADVGAAALICEPADVAAGRGAPGYGTCVVRTAYLDPDGPLTAAAVAAALDCCWTAVTGGAVPPSLVDTVLDDSPVGRAVCDWLDRTARDLRREAEVAYVDGGCLGPLRRVAGLLAAGGDTGSRRVVVTASAEGNVALAAVTVFPRAPRLPLVPAASHEPS